MVDIRLRHSFGRNVLNSNRVRGKILAAMERVARELKKNAESTTKTFVSFDVEWRYDTRYSGGSAHATATTDNEIFGYLNDGTSARWAIMNYAFEPKTAPGQIESGEGWRTYNKNGEYTAIRGRKAMMERGLGPQPGIDARHFDQSIADSLQDWMIRELEDAIMEGID